MSKYSPYTNNKYAYKTVRDDTPMEHYEHTVIKQVGIKQEILNLSRKAYAFNIPASTNVGYWDSNPEYVMLSPEEDYDQINKALDNAKRLNRLEEDPPAIVAIVPRLGMKIPKWYYIKNDLPNYRKKKVKNTKVKRKVCKCK